MFPIVVTSNNPYMKYTIYGKFHSNICGTRCCKVVSKPIFQKCTCITPAEAEYRMKLYFDSMSK